MGGYVLLSGMIGSDSPKSGSSDSKILTFIPITIQFNHFACTPGRAPLPSPDNCDAEAHNLATRVPLRLD